MRLKGCKSFEKRKCKKIFIKNCEIQRKRNPHYMTVICK